MKIRGLHYTLETIISQIFFCTTLCKSCETKKNILYTYAGKRRSIIEPKREIRIQNYLNSLKMCSSKYYVHIYEMHSNIYLFKPWFTCTFE